MKEITNAYNTLKDPKKREAYDLKLRFDHIGQAASSGSGNQPSASSKASAGSQAKTSSGSAKKTASASASSKAKAGSGGSAKSSSGTKSAPKYKPRSSGSQSQAKASAGASSAPRSGPRSASSGSQAQHSSTANRAPRPTPSPSSSINQPVVQTPKAQIPSAQSRHRYERAGIESSAPVLLVMLGATVIFGILSLLALIGSNPNLSVWSYAIVFILVDVQGLILIALTPNDLVAIISASISSAAGFGQWCVVGYNIPRATIHVSWSTSTATQVIGVVLIVSSLIWLYRILSAVSKAIKTI